MNSYSPVTKARALTILATFAASTTISLYAGGAGAQEQAPMAPPPAVVDQQVPGPPPPGYPQQPDPPGYPQQPPPGGYQLQPPPGAHQAHPPSHLPPVAYVPSPEVQALLQSGRGLRGPGTGMTIAGGVLLPVGLLLTGAGAVAGPYAGSGGVYVFYTGAAMAALGTALLGVGIPLWAVGQSRMNRAGRLALARYASDAPRFELRPLYASGVSKPLGGMAGLSFSL